MGEVWAAEDRVLGRRVAIKRILGSPSATDVLRLEREAKLAATLHHPNIVGVHDLVSSDGRTYLVMDLVDGTSLADLLTTAGSLTPLRAASLMREVCDAVDFAHRRGVIHRDIKPANVLVSREGRAYVTDFGVARATSTDAAGLTGTGMVIGTVRFMAPEVALGRPAGPASDVYSLGATLFACVEGRSPLAGGGGPEESTAAQLLRLVSAPAPPPTQAGALRPLIMAMLDAEPGRRPSLPECVAELAAVAAGSRGATLPLGVAPAQPPVGPTVVRRPDAPTMPAERSAAPWSAHGPTPAPPQPPHAMPPQAMPPHPMPPHAMPPHAMPPQPVPVTTYAAGPARPAASRHRWWWAVPAVAAVVTAAFLLWPRPAPSAPAASPVAGTPTAVAATTQPVPPPSPSQPATVTVTASAAPPSTATPTPTPAPTPTQTPTATGVRPEAGTYTGLAHQRALSGTASDMDYDVEFTLSSSGSTVRYPSLGCSGTLRPVGWRDNGARLYIEETVSPGCDSGGTWAVTVRGDRELDASYTPLSGRYVVTVNLTR